MLKGDVNLPTNHHWPNAGSREVIQANLFVDFGALFIVCLFIVIVVPETVSIKLTRNIH